MNKKILIAGNQEYGLSGALYKKWPDATFISRSTGLKMDLCLLKNQRHIAELSLEYDVFISVSSLWKFHQTSLVQEVSKKWKEQKHKGYIIAVGSSADTPVKASTWLYPGEKKALRAYCRGVSQMVSGDNYSGFKMTYLSPGWMRTPIEEKKHPDIPKLDLEYVANTVEWLINQPDTVNISELCLDEVRITK
jgi:NAD(P)-dependent dehydrogenase (short-subunit alcohol dehydrogenase family)